MRHFVFRWMVTTIAVFVAAPIVGINYGDRLGCLLGASLLLGIINAFIRPVLLLLSLPLILVTLGVFILIINERIFSRKRRTRACAHSSYADQARPGTSDRLITKATESSCSSKILAQARAEL